jgi:hypothetical protein
LSRLELIEKVVIFNDLMLYRVKESDTYKFRSIQSEITLLQEGSHAPLAC